MTGLLRNPIVLAVLGVLALVLLLSSVTIVPETRQAVVLRFSEPVKLVNRYHQGEEFGRSGAGVILRIPFVDRLVWVDKRILDVDMERQQVLSTDQLRLNVDAFARYRIVDPLRMYITAGNESRVSDQLRPILGSALRNELGRVPFAALLSPERGQIMSNIEANLNRVASQYGAQIVDVRIKRADLPDGSPLESAFARMRNAREQEALTIDAQGRQQAALIRADADAEASRTYATSYNQDPDFYDFYRAMQSYRHTFGADGSDPQGSATAVLSADNEYLQQFRGRR